MYLPKKERTRNRKITAILKRLKFPKLWCKIANASLAHNAKLLEIPHTRGICKCYAIINDIKNNRIYKQLISISDNTFLYLATKGRLLVQNYRLRGMDDRGHF